MTKTNTTGITHRNWAGILLLAGLLACPATAGRLRKQSAAPPL